jgi:Protein of unknown function (DUF3102)
MKIAKTKRTQEQWIEALTALHQKSADGVCDAVENLIEEGRALSRAKAELKHGEWLPVLRKVGLQEDYAQRLMRLANNPRFAKTARLRHLPNSVNALLALSNVPEDVLDAAEASGALKGMTAKEAKRIIAYTAVEKPRVSRIPMTVRTETIDLRVPPGHVQREPEEPHVFNPACRDEEKRRTEIEALDRRIDHMLESMNRLDELGLDLALAEIEPGGREDLKALVEHAIAALTALRQALDKPVVEGKVA